MKKFGILLLVGILIVGAVYLFMQKDSVPKVNEGFGYVSGPYTIIRDQPNVEGSGYTLLGSAVDSTWQSAIGLNLFEYSVYTSNPNPNVNDTITILIKIKHNMNALYNWVISNYPTTNYNYILTGSIAIWSSDGISGTPTYIPALGGSWCDFAINVDPSLLPPITTTGGYKCATKANAWGSVITDTIYCSVPYKITSTGNLLSFTFNFGGDFVRPDATMGYSSEIPFGGYKYFPSSGTINIGPKEDPPPQPSTPVVPYPFSCADTYTIKIVYSPPDANRNITFYAMLLLQSGATDVATKSSTWTVTNAPNFAVKTGAPVIQHWNDKITWQFPLAQTYTVQYTLTYGGKTCSFSFPITIAGQTCTDPCTNLNTATNTCQKITLPPPPPRTKNGPRCQDVKCGPNQFKDCPVIYQPGNSPTNPCGPGNVYDFLTSTCVPSGEYCCNYSLTTGGLDQTKFAGARNDTKCVDNLTQQYRIKATSPTPCRLKYTPGIDNPCCDPRAATLAKCAPYWEAVPGWKKNPMNCQVAPPYQGFMDYDGYESKEFASIDQETIAFTKGALQRVRQKFIDMKNLFM
jgi:hypothetical protein